MKLLYKIFLLIAVLFPCFSFCVHAKEIIKPNATTEEIQQAIDRLPGRGGVVTFSSGTYMITKPIILPAFVTLEGMDGTIFKASKSMSAMIQTKGFSSFSNSHTAMWHDTSGVPMNYSIANIQLDGNHYSKVGIQMYGYNFNLQHLQIQNCETGILTDWSGWHGKDTWNDNYSKFFESSVSHINIQNCTTGIQWNHLTDAYLNDITLSNCQTGLNIQANVYGNQIKANHCTVGINFDSDSSFSDIHLSNNDCGIKVNHWYVTMNNLAGNGNKKDIIITPKSKHILIRDSHLSNIDNQGDDVRIKKGTFSISQKEIPQWNVESKRMVMLSSATLQDDSTKAIQDAIDSLRNTGGIVYLPGGVYRITGKLLLYSNIYLIGEGPYATNIYLSDSTNSVMLESVENSTSFGIKNIGFFGNKYNNQKGTCLRIRGSGFLMDHIWIDSAAENGIEVVSDAANQSYINNLNVKYCKEKGAVFLGNPNVYINNLTVSECQNTGVELHSSFSIAFAHLYANHGNYQYVDEAGAPVCMIVSESANGIATLLKKPSLIETLQTYANKKQNLYVDTPGVKIGIFQSKDSNYIQENYPIQYDIPFIIKKANIKISGLTDQEYQGSAIHPNIKVYDDQQELKKDKDYLVTYQNNVNAGTAKGKIVCIGNYEGEKTFSFSIQKRNISHSKLSGFNNKIVTGKALYQSIMIKDNNKTLQVNKDYKVSYQNNKNIGTAQCIITGINNYKGIIRKNFDIIPKSTNIKKISSLKKGLKIVWNKKAYSGYQIQYSMNKNFSRSKTITITKPKITSKTINHLKSKTTYYIRIRTLEKRKYYSTWSPLKKVKTK